MAKALGPTFPREVTKNATLKGKPFAWAPDGTITGRQNLTAAENTALDNLIAAHNASAPLVPIMVERRQWFQQMSVIGKFSQKEALDAAGSGTQPGTVASYI